MRPQPVLSLPASPCAGSEHCSDGGEQMGRVHRLRNVTLESGQERLATVFRPGIRRERDRRDLATAVERQLPHAANERQAVFSGHGDVAQKDVGLQALDELERPASRRRRRDEHPVLLEDQSQGFARVLLVVDEQDREAIQKAVAGCSVGRSPTALVTVKSTGAPKTTRATRPSATR